MTALATVLVYQRASGTQLIWVPLGSVEASAVPSEVLDLVAYNGGDGARFHLQVFSDYACAHCRTLVDDLPKAVSGLGVEVSTTWRAFPPGSGANGVLLHRAAYCLGERPGADMDWVRRELFRMAEAPPPFDWATLTRTLGPADHEQFSDCIDEEAVPETIQRDIDDAIRLNLIATPSILFNGFLITGNPGPRALEATLKHLSRASMSAS
jgi:protein-disulfide isomerase